MANQDEKVNFKAGSDTGQNNAASVQPIANGEVVYEGVDNRPLENLRKRTEALRARLEEVLYYADYDRSLLLRSDGTFTLTQPSAGNYQLSLSGDDLYVVPALTPGRQSGGRWRGGRVFVGTLPYSGMPLLDDLILTASAQYTGMRGYADADNLGTTFALTVGANRVTVDLVADGALAQGSVTFTVTGDPKVNVVIRYGTLGGVTSLTALMAAINGDTSSQGTWGVGNLFRASSTAVSPGTTGPVAFTGGIVQGAYDAEAHKVTASQMTAFFAAIEGGVQINLLKEGEGLSIAYPKGVVEKGVATPKGGRRQSLWDLPTDKVGGQTNNTSPVAGWSLFSTGREPEKIPGSVPIGKILNGEFVFIDGTRLPVDGSSGLGDSSVLRTDLGSETLGDSGAALIGYDGSGFWHADASGSPNPALPASDVNEALDNIVAHLAADVSGNSGARRIGVEALTASWSVGNIGFLTGGAASIRQVLDSLYGRAPTLTTSGGVTYRVSERGHVLHGMSAIEKFLGETTPVNLSAGGARAFGAQLPSPPAPNYSAGLSRKLTTAFEMLEPLGFNFGGNDILNIPETITGVPAGVNKVLLASFTSARATALSTGLQTAFHSLDGAQVTRHLYCRIANASDSTKNGLYLFDGWDTATPAVALANLDGTPANFTGLTSGQLTFLQGVTLGSDAVGHRLKLYHYGGYEIPPIDIAFAGTPPGGAMLMRVVDDNMYPDATSEYWTTHAIWNKASKVRHTDNILVTGDKSLLDGVETGTVVDASASHHHGAAYTRYVPLTPANQTFVTAVSATPTFTQLAGANGDSFVGPAVSGHTVVAYVIEVSLTVVVDGAAAADDPFDLGISSTPGITFAGNVVQVEGHTGYKVKASPATATYRLKKHVVIPVDGSRRAVMKNVGTTNVSEGASTLVARVTGAYAYPT